MKQIGDVIPLPAPANREPSRSASPGDGQDRCPACHGLMGNAACSRCEGSGVVCAVCHGAGFVIAVARDGAESMKPCPRGCSQERATRRRRQRIAMNWPMPPLIADLSKQPLDTYPHLQRAIEVVRRFIERRPQGVILALDGNYGVGKTHLLAFIYRTQVEDGGTAIFLTAMVAEKMLTNFDGTLDTPLSPVQVWNDLVGVDLLILDEADRYTSKEGEGYFEKNLFTLVNERLSAKRSIVLAGNRLRDHMHPGIVSRASAADCAWIDLTHSPDMRPRYARGDPRWLE